MCPSEASSGDTAAATASARSPMPPIRVGHVEIGDPVEDLEGSPEFTAARLLVTVDGVAIGQATVALSDGRVAARDIDAAIRDQLGAAIAVAAGRLPGAQRALTVVIATRNRPSSLGRCLRSLVRSDHPLASIIVVDNDPDDDTAAVVHALDDPRIAYVREPRRGTSIGRNRGLAAAASSGAGPVVFIDDVEVDRAWAGRMAAALAEPGVACVSGPVPAARLDTAAQIRAEHALGWQKGFTRRRFSLAQPPSDSAVFPFSPGLFGVGANLGVNSAVALQVGGFDAALGPGTPTHGGEDCKFMIRLGLAGHVLAYEPSAYLWHHHRPSQQELDDQLRRYAIGLGAFLAKVALDPVGRAAATRRLPAAVRQLWRIRTRGLVADTTTGGPRQLGLGALLSGARAHLRARRAAQRTGDTMPALTAGHTN